MGMIQNSINQLTLSLLGATGSVAHGISKTGLKPAPKVGSNVKAETKGGMGNIVKYGMNPNNRNVKSYTAAVNAMYSANDAINQKAVSHYNPVAVRLDQVKAASSLSVSTDTKGGSK